MTSKGPRFARLVAASALAFGVACSDLDRSASLATPDTVAPHASDEDLAPQDRVELREGAQELAEPEQALRALGYADAASEPGRIAGKAKRPRAAAADAEALSELDYQASQSMNQRANEAFDYLGAGASVPAGAAKLSVAKNQPATSRPARQPGELDVRLEEASRFRDALAAGALADKKRVAASINAGERADAPQRRAQESQAEAFSAARRFQRERRSLEHLEFQHASGYWANTYVPGDPVMRWLESRLEKRDRAALEAFASQRLLLEAAARQMPQPFDPPGTAAVSVFLQADRRGLEGEGRMLVQVGLRGAERHSGLRPAMSVGIVLDLRGTVSTETAATMRALSDGFLAAKDVGDRFSLTVAGRPGGTLVPPDAFRHGPLSLVMASLIEPPASGWTTQPVIGLEEAVRATAAELRRSDDPAAPLGSSLVLLVTSQPLGALTEALVAAAHESAVAGVPVSVVGIGDQAQLAELERVALAGQGNRRLLRAAAEAERLVQRELSALSRVIARALRLRIRLAPGVKLVEVVGSEQLDASGAQRVRQAERSIDRRLARNLGIEADRGEDEEGIQIVMPTFHSGDAHAVLLDVVAPGPGPIADVTVRYKDLVYLRNSVARANLTLPHSADPPGPLERNVVKNYLATRLSETLKQAGRALLSGADHQVIASVRDFQALLEGLRREVPGFQNDADLANDAAMLGEYLALLETGALQQDEPRLYLADSLQLSGYFKTIPRSNSDLQVSRR